MKDKFMGAYAGINLKQKETHEVSGTLNFCLEKEKITMTLGSASGGCSLSIAQRNHLLGAPVTLSNKELKTAWVSLDLIEFQQQQACSGVVGLREDSKPSLIFIITMKKWGPWDVTRLKAQLTSCFPHCCAYSYVHKASLDGGKDGQIAW